MHYRFPEICTINDVFPHIEDRDEFIVAEREGYTTTWDSEDEVYMKRDAASFLQSIIWILDTTNEGVFNRGKNYM